MAFDLEVVVSWLWRDQTPYQIWAKSKHPWPSYGDLNIENLGLTAILDFTLSEFQQLRSFQNRTVHQFTIFQQHRTIHDWLINYWRNFSLPFSEGTNKLTVHKDGSGPNYTKFGDNINQSWSPYSLHAARYKVVEDRLMRSATKM